MKTFTRRVLGLLTFASVSGVMLFCAEGWKSNLNALEKSSAPEARQDGPVKRFIRFHRAGSRAGFIGSGQQTLPPGHVQDLGAGLIDLLSRGRVDAIAAATLHVETAVLRELEGPHEGVEIRRC